MGYSPKPGVPGTKPRCLTPQDPQAAARVRFAVNLHPTERTRVAQRRRRLPLAGSSMPAPQPPTTRLSGADPVTPAKPTAEGLSNMLFLPFSS